MSTKRAKTKQAAEHVGVAPYFLINGAKSGLLIGTFFRIGTRGDYLWDLELLEEKLKELTKGDAVQPDKVVDYGKLRRVGG